MLEARRIDKKGVNVRGLLLVKELLDNFVQVIRGVVEVANIESKGEVSQFPGGNTTDELI